MVAIIRQDEVRMPPHSVEAEQAVLGGLMLDSNAWDAVADIVAAADFYRRDHRLIFEAIVDVAEIARLLRRGHDLRAPRAQGPARRNRRARLPRHDRTRYALGGERTRLCRDHPRALDAAAARRRRRARLRLQRPTAAGAPRASSWTKPSGACSRLPSAAAAAARASSPCATSCRRRSTASTLLHQTPGEIRGVPTGFTQLDRKTTGLQPGDLVVIAGRPSMGKTTLAVNIAENAAIAKGMPVAIFSMEMSAEQLTLRLISSLGRVNQSHLRTGNFNDEDWSRIQGAMSQLLGAPIFVDESPALTPTEVRARARRLKREHDIGLIVVDYLQLMQVRGTKENRATEISEISRSLKALAKELKVPVVALSQLNRAVEQRTDKKPVMSDLRESGAIEQDSDLILLIYREEVYDPNTTRRGIADIIIAKQRNGPIGEVQLTFLGEYTRFENLVAESYGEGAF